MSIRAIALELYRAQRKVAQLEACLKEAPLHEKDALRKELQEAKAEWQVLRNMLNAEKSPAPFRTRPSTLKRGQ